MLAISIKKVVGEKPWGVRNAFLRGFSSRLELSNMNEIYHNQHDAERNRHNRPAGWGSRLIG